MKVLNKILAILELPRRRTGDIAARKEVALLHEISAAQEELNFWRHRHFFSTHDDVAKEAYTYGSQWSKYIEHLQSQLHSTEDARLDRVLEIHQALADEVTEPLDENRNS